MAALFSFPASQTSWSLAALQIDGHTIYIFVSERYSKPKHQSSVCVGGVEGTEQHMAWKTEQY